MHIPLLGSLILIVASFSDMVKHFTFISTYFEFCFFHNILPLISGLLAIVYWLLVYLLLFHNHLVIPICTFFFLSYRSQVLILKLRCTIQVLDVSLAVLSKALGDCKISLNDMYISLQIHFILKKTRLFDCFLESMNY